MARQIDLVYHMLDDQLVDVDGRRCGRADDLELEGELGGELYVRAILSGSGTWARRLPYRLRGLAERVFGEGVRGEDVIQVPWDVVESIDGGAVDLRARAPELGLGAGDDKAAPAIRRLPGS